MAFWFEFAGLLTVIFGLTIDRMEKENVSIPPVIGYGFSSLVVLAIIAMPVGGGWLLVPGALGLLVKRQNGHSRAAI